VLSSNSGASTALSVDNYNVFSDGIGYDVEYQGPPSADGSDYQVWTRSARTIHFAAPPALAGLPHFTATTGSPGWTPVRNWAAWAPPSGTAAAVIGAITRALATQYRLGSPGAPLVSVHAAPVLQTGTGPDSIAALAVQTSANSTHLISYSTDATWEFRLCGSGPDCAITSGTPTVVRDRLVRREALELALYAFEYAPDLGAVLVSMPAAPGSGPPSYVLYFRRASLENELRRPLSQTLRLAAPPLATQADPTEAGTIDRLTLPALFDSHPIASGTVRVLLLSPGQ
jgi:hypothetical protein